MLLVKKVGMPDLNCLHGFSENTKIGLFSGIRSKMFVVARKKPRDCGAFQLYVLFAVRAKEFFRIRQQADQ